MAAGAVVAVTAVADKSDSVARGQYSALKKAGGPDGLIVVTEAEAARVAASTDGPIWVSDVGLPVDIKSARRVRTGEGDLQVWVAKGVEGGTCILTWVPSLRIGGPGSVCSSAQGDGALSEQAGSRSDPSAKVIAGVAPDGAKQATITTTDGAATTVPVVENVYYARTHSSAHTVEYSDAGDKHTIDAGGQ